MCLYRSTQRYRTGYNELAQWIADNGYESTGVVYEVYLNDPDLPPGGIRNSDTVSAERLVGDFAQVIIMKACFVNRFLLKCMLIKLGYSIKL